MKDVTSKTLSIIAWTIWILGGFGSLVVYGNLNDIFKETYFDSIPGAVLLVSIFNAFCTGMIFMGLSNIINKVDQLTQTIEKANDVKELVGSSNNEDVLKF